MRHRYETCAICRSSGFLGDFVENCEKKFDLVVGIFLWVPMFRKNSGKRNSLQGWGDSIARGNIFL